MCKFPQGALSSAWAVGSRRRKATQGNKYSFLYVCWRPEITYFFQFFETRRFYRLRRTRFLRLTTRHCCLERLRPRMKSYSRRVSMRNPYSIIATCHTCHKWFTYHGPMKYCPHCGATLNYKKLTTNDTKDETDSKTIEACEYWWGNNCSRCGRRYVQPLNGVPDPTYCPYCRNKYPE